MSLLWQQSHMFSLMFLRFKGRQTFVQTCSNGAFRQLAFETYNHKFSDNGQTQTETQAQTILTHNRCTQLAHTSILQSRPVQNSIRSVYQSSNAPGRPMPCGANTTAMWQVKRHNTTTMNAIKANECLLPSL